MDGAARVGGRARAARRRAGGCVDGDSAGGLGVMAAEMRAAACDRDHTGRRCGVARSW